LGAPSPVRSDGPFRQPNMTAAPVTAEAPSQIHCRREGKFEVCGGWAEQETAAERLPPSAGRPAGTRPADLDHHLLIDSWPSKYRSSVCAGSEPRCVRCCRCPHRNSPDGPYTRWPISALRNVVRATRQFCDPPRRRGTPRCLALDGIPGWLRFCLPVRGTARRERKRPSRIVLTGSATTHSRSHHGIALHPALQGEPDKWAKPLQPKNRLTVC